MKHIRAGSLALKLLGVILVIFGGIDIVRCLLGMFADSNGSIAYLSSLISSGFLLLIGVVMMIVASIIKKKFIK